MARYRVFEKNPISNEWIDRDWVEADGQDAAKRALASDGTELFAVPETSWHPTRFARKEILQAQATNGDGTAVVGATASGEAE